MQQLNLTIDDMTCACSTQRVGPVLSQLVGVVQGRVNPPKSCFERILIPDFEKSAQLPTRESVVVEYVPGEPGEYEFTCQMGMFRGKLIVE